MAKVKQPIKVHGGKYYLQKTIHELAPPSYVTRAIGYAGGMAEFWNWPCPQCGQQLDSNHPKECDGVSELVNDLNGDIHNFWTILGGESFDNFKREVVALPFSGVEFMASQKEIIDQFEFNCLGRAIYFFVRARQSRQGLMKDFATTSRNRTRRGMNEQVSSWLTAIEGLSDVHDRLKRAMLFNMDAIRFICRQDGLKTFFYLDPPYLHDTRVSTSAYEHEMTYADHVDLLCLLAVKSGKFDEQRYEDEGVRLITKTWPLLERKFCGKFLLSGYDSTLYRSFKLANKWRLKKVKIDNKASSKKIKDIKTECFWMNY